MQLFSAKGPIVVAPCYLGLLKIKISKLISEPGAGVKLL